MSTKLLLPSRHPSPSTILSAQGSIPFVRRSSELKFAQTSLRPTYQDIPNPKRENNKPRLFLSFPLSLFLLPCSFFLLPSPLQCSPPLRLRTRTRTRTPKRQPNWQTAIRRCQTPNDKRHIPRVPGPGSCLAHGTWHQGEPRQGTAGRHTADGRHAAYGVRAEEGREQEQERGGKQE